MIRDTVPKFYWYQYTVRYQIQYQWTNNNLIHTSKEAPELIQDGDFWYPETPPSPA